MKIFEFIIFALGMTLAFLLDALQSLFGHGIVDKLKKGK